CFFVWPIGLVQSLVPSARPMKFSTPIGATLGNSVQWRSPAEVWMMAVGSACAAPSREVERIRTSVCIRVRMVAPLSVFAIFDCTTVDPSLSVERRAYPPGGAGETPVAPLNSLSRSHGGQSLLNALFEQLVCVDLCLGISDGFEAASHLEVERESSVVRRVRGVGLEVETPASGFIGTGTLDDCPGLSEFAGEFQNAVDLIATRESAAVKKDFASGNSLQQEAGSFEHHLHHEVVLLYGVFNIFWRE